MTQTMLKMAAPLVVYPSSDRVFFGGRRGFLGPEPQDRHHKIREPARVGTG
jgi:hypothetical protein